MATSALNPDANNTNTNARPNTIPPDPTLRSGLMNTTGIASIAITVTHTGIVNTMAMFLTVLIFTAPVLWN
jgi:hypothetical protein